MARVASNRKTGSKSARTRGKATRTTPATLPIPKPISTADFEAICRPYHIRATDRERLLEEINSIIAQIRRSMKTKRQESSRDQVRRLKSSANHIREALLLLDARADDPVLSFGAERLASMISPLWLRQQFPADEMAPTAAGLAPFVDDQVSLMQRQRFIDNRPVESIIKILQTLEAAFADALVGRANLVGAKGGPKPLIARRIFIQMLAVRWKRLGKKVLTSPKSDFVAFVDNVMDAIGWPSDLRGEGGAVTAAIGEAIRHWRNLTKS